MRGGEPVEPAALYLGTRCSPLRLLRKLLGGFMHVSLKRVERPDDWEETED